MATVYLIIVLLVPGGPITDWQLFHSYKDCLKAKIEILKYMFNESNGQQKPLYLECKSDPGEKVEVKHKPYATD